MADYYEILEVSREASQDEIRSAFRRLSLDLHPDRTQSDPELTRQYQLVTEAYEVLSIAEVRRAYDDALMGYGTQAPRFTIKDILEGIGSMAGLFMEAVARANPSKVEGGTCVICNGSGDIAVDVGVIHLSKRCEGCQGSGRIAAQTTAVGDGKK